MVPEIKRYTEEDFARFRRLKHSRRGRVEWVFPSFGEPVLTFDRITYYNGYRDRDLLTPEQIRILREDGVLGCIGFRVRLRMVRSQKQIYTSIWHPCWSVV